ncbi:MAG TPA: transaldolase [Anaerolineales bacterium]
MGDNPLKQLELLGQSIWLDYISRGMIQSGELQRLIEEDGVSGVTVNPSILDKAISSGREYDGAIRDLAAAGRTPAQIYETLAVQDVQKAADLFRPIYERHENRNGRTPYRDGYVSLEVSPYLAHDSEATMAEARRFWQELDRPNVMIKVPATQEGLLAIRQLTAEGININITLLFGLERYRDVIAAYLSGLEDRARQSLPVDRIDSVASFFLSRIDVLLDPVIAEKEAHSTGEQSAFASRLRGQPAVASAKVSYQIFLEKFNGVRFQKLAAQGAHLQRLLWASTGTKNPDYSDVKYVEPLIGAFTINTLPLETLEAFRDHGKAATTIEHAADDANRTLENLKGIGIDLLQATQQLEDEGIQKFSQSYDHLMQVLQKIGSQARTESTH